MATDERIAKLNAHYKGLHVPYQGMPAIFKDQPDRWMFKKRAPTDMFVPYLFLRNQWCRVVFTDLNDAESYFAHHWDEETERSVSPYPLIYQYAKPHGVILCEGKCVVIVHS